MTRISENGCKILSGCRIVFPWRQHYQCIVYTPKHLWIHTLTQTQLGTSIFFSSISLCTFPKKNMTMEHSPLEDVFPIEHWEINQCHLSFQRCISSWNSELSLSCCGVHHKNLVTRENQNLKIDSYCALVMKGFSNCLGLFQAIMANPVLLDVA